MHHIREYVRLFIRIVAAAAVLLIGSAIQVQAEAVLEAAYPYYADGRENAAAAGSTQLLYIDVECYNMPEEQPVRISVELPDSFSVPSLPEGWTMSDGVLSTEQTIPADYGLYFNTIPVKADTEAGSRTIRIRADGPEWSKTKEIPFTLEQCVPEDETASGTEKKAVPLSWYIQNVTVPVDEHGNSDVKQQNGTIQVPDITMERFRSWMMGKGAVNWTAVLEHPAAHVLVEMRNPQKDTRTVHFKAELTDRVTGKIIPGLCMAAQSDSESGAGWGGKAPGGNASTAVVGLDGKAAQSFVIPLYVDPFSVSEGDCNLRITLWDQEGTRTIDVPVKIIMTRNLGLFSVGFASVCLLSICLSFRKLKRYILKIGARGAVTISLFAALAFGSVVVPVTIFGNLLQVVLGPFSGLLSGLLSGVLQYLLLMALLTMFRRPGTAALFFLIKWLLSGVLFGQFTPIGMLAYAVYIAVIEAVLWGSGFYRRRELSVGYMIFLSLLIGCAEALITLLNMEQIMFFYRLYYADWFIALYMIVDGVLYSSAGCWLGWHIGSRLRQIMGE